jgi:hypothetical protein
MERAEARADLGAGLITLAHCLRAERFVERHPEVFCDGMKLSVSEAADVAVGYTVFATQRIEDGSSR